MHKLKLHVAVTSGDRGAICMKQMYYCICCNFIEFFSHSKLFGLRSHHKYFLHRLGYTPYAIRHTISANKLKYGKQTEIRQAN